MVASGHTDWHNCRSSLYAASFFSLSMYSPDFICHKHGFDLYKSINCLINSGVANLIPLAGIFKNKIVSPWERHEKRPITSSSGHSLCNMVGRPIRLYEIGPDLLTCSYNFDRIGLYVQSNCMIPLTCDFHPIWSKSGGWYDQIVSSVAGFSVHEWPVEGWLSLVLWSVHCETWSA